MADRVVYVPAVSVALSSLRALQAAQGELTRNEAIIAARNVACELDRMTLVRVVACLAMVATWDVPELGRRGEPLSWWLSRQAAHCEAVAGEERAP